MSEADMDAREALATGIMFVVGVGETDQATDQVWALLGDQGYAIVRSDDVRLMMGAYIGHGRHVDNAKECDPAWERLRAVLSDTANQPE